MKAVDLDAAFARLSETANRIADQRAVLLRAMREVEDYFDDRADVDDGIPNGAMKMLVMVQDAIAKATAP